MHLDLNTIPPNLRSILERKIGYKRKLTAIKECDSKNDWNKLVFIMNKAFEDTRDLFDRDEGPLSPEAGKEKFENMKIFFALKSHFEIGFVAISTRKEANGKKNATISLMAVLPEFRRQGIGTILAMFCYDWLMTKEIDDLYALVGHNNKASYNFMQSLGFKKIKDEIINC